MIPLKVKVITEKNKMYEPHETHLVYINEKVAHVITDEQAEFLINKMKKVFYGYDPAGVRGLISVEGLASLKLIFDFDEKANCEGSFINEAIIYIQEKLNFGGLHK